MAAAEPAQVPMDPLTPASNDATDGDGIPLTSLDNSTEMNHTLQPSQSRTHTALPPTDRGYHAWLALSGAFLSNALIWGFALSFGVLQEYYRVHEPFASAPSGIAAIGTTATGLMYLTMPIYLIMFQPYPRWRPWALRASLPIIAVALVGASFANTVPQLLACQGVIYAIAGNALVMPTINLLNEWFAARRGLAIGVAIAGDGVGGVVMPLVLQALLSAVGFRWTLRIVAAIIVTLASPLPFLLKPRLPVSATSIAAPIDAAFLKGLPFWTLQIFSIIQALGYFIPSNYLPTIAQSLGLTSTLGSLTVVLVNLGTIAGCIGVGALVDRFEVTLVLAGLSCLAGVSVFAILGSVRSPLSTAEPPLYLFSLLYGLTAGAYSTTWGGMIKDLQRRYENTDANVVFGLLAAGRGLGAIVSGPLSEVLVQGASTVKSAGWAASAYESPFAPVIVFSGCTALVGGASWVVRRCGVI